jgi:hypothetical protein
MSTGTTWQPSPEMQLLLTNLTGLLAVDSVSLQFLPMGTTTLRIDDGVSRSVEEHLAAGLHLR